MRNITRAPRDYRYGDEMEQHSIRGRDSHRARAYTRLIEYSSIYELTVRDLLATSNPLLVPPGVYRYNDPIKMTSRRISSDAEAILVYKSALPITRAASRTSRHASSSRVMQRTIVPSWTSVSCVICWNDCGAQRARGSVQSACSARHSREPVRAYHALGPFVHDLDQAKLEFARAIEALIGKVGAVALLHSHHAIVRLEDARFAL